MTEKYWDPINKAAALVTLFTGVPAFLTFIGLSYFAAVVLGALSIASLSFVFIRGRKLQARGDRFAELNKNDEQLISYFNNIIAERDVNRLPFHNLESLLTDALNNIKKYVESDTSCKVSASLREIKPNLDVVQVIASSNRDAKPLKFNLKEDSCFSSVWYGNPTKIFYPQEKSKYENYHTPRFTKAYHTVAMFPIMTKPKTYNGDCEH